MESTERGIDGRGLTRMTRIRKSLVAFIRVIRVNPWQKPLRLCSALSVVNNAAWRDQGLMPADAVENPSTLIRWPHSRLPAE
jgi:hypothetical protein